MDDRWSCADQIDRKPIFVKFNSPAKISTSTCLVLFLSSSSKAKQAIISSLFPSHGCRTGLRIPDPFFGEQGAARPFHIQVFSLCPPQQKLTSIRAVSLSPPPIAPIHGLQFQRICQTANARCLPRKSRRN